MEIDRRYVCVPSAGGPTCAESCTAPTDCGPLGGGPAHDDGSLCLPGGDCGCGTSMHCMDARFPSCDRESETCETSDCVNNQDCTAPLLCFGGRCQTWACPGGLEDCAGERGSPACIAGPGGTIRVCSDNCLRTEDCVGGLTCQGPAGDRRCMP